MIKENKDKRITVRFTETDMLYFKIACYQAGTTPSKFLRMLSDSAINAVKLEESKGAIKVEDYEALFNN